MSIASNVMEAIAVGGLVVAVVSAFTSIANLFKRNTSPRRVKYNVYALDRSLDLGSLRVQEAYDRDLARLGPRFARGDAITIDQLRDVVIRMQSRMIHVLEALLDGRQENFHPLLDMSDSSRIRALRALADQYQRMSIAAPLKPHRLLVREEHFESNSQHIIVRESIMDHAPQNEIFDWRPLRRKEVYCEKRTQRVIAEPFDGPVIRRQKSGHLALVRKSSGHFQRFFT